MTFIFEKDYNIEIFYSPFTVYYVTKICLPVLLYCLRYLEFA